MNKFGLLDLLKNVNPDEVGKTLNAVHYSNQDGILRRLDPNAYGTGMPGAEKTRLADAPDIAPRTHFYAEGSRQQPNYATPRPESMISGAPYAGKLTRIYDLKENPLGLKLRGNDLERALKEYGFNGYTDPGSGIIVNLQGSPEVQRLGDFRGAAEENIRRSSRLPDQPSIITAENIPSTQTELGAWLNKQPLDIRERYTDEVEQMLDKMGLMKGLGVKDYQVNQGYGGYEGGTNPNSIIRVPDDEAAQRVATARGVLTQQDAVPYYRPDAGGETQGIRATMREGVNPEVLADMQRGTGQDFTRSDLDQVDFLNFDGAENFDQQISQYLAELDATDSISPFQATSNYNPTGGAAAASTPEGVQLLGEGSGLDEVRGGIENYNQKFRKQYGAVNPLLAAGMAGGGLMALMSQDAEANSYDKLLKELNDLADQDDLKKIDYDALDEQVAASFDQQPKAMQAPAPAPRQEGLPPEYLLKVDDDQLSQSNSLLDQLMADPERRALAEKAGFNLDDPMYHATRSQFRAFDPSKVDVGSHMGSRQQATARMEDTRTYGRDDEAMIPLLHKTKNPLMMPDVGNWEQADAVLMELVQGQSMNGDIYPEGPWRELADLAVRQRHSFDSPGQWTHSPENREMLDRVNRELSMRGYDSIKYRNTVETREGLLPEFDKEYRQHKADYQALQEEVARRERALDPPAREAFADDQSFRDAQYDHAVAQRDAQEPLEALLAKRQAAYDRMNALSSDPSKQFPDHSLIVLDPKDIRNPGAKFDPKKQQSRDLLAKVTGAAPMVGGGLLAAMSMTPEDVMAQGMEDSLPAVGSAVEQYGRFGAQGLADLAMGESAPDLQGQSINPSEQMQKGMKTLFDPVKQGLMELIGKGQDAAYPYVTAALEYEPPLSNQSIGDDLQDTFSAIGAGWDELSDDTKTRLGGAGAVLLTAADFLPGGKAKDVIDPRFFTRVSERRAASEGTARLPDLGINERPIQAPEVSLTDFEGRPFITSMSDRSRAGGTIESVDGRQLPIPVNAQGGQDYMFENPGAVWASDPGPSKAILNEARRVKAETGQDPLFIPWRMAPTGIDHATMSGDLLISNAIGTLPKKDLKMADKAIRELKINGRAAGIPDWPGMDKPDEAMAAWANASGSQRKAIKDKVFDTMLREQTGLSQPQARLAMTDPSQINEPDFAFHNIGLLDADQDLMPSRHRTYSAELAGEGIGRLSENNLTLFDLFPELMDSPQPHRKAMKPLSGTITSGLLDALMR